jgi:O-succinylbenzoic acid--CoA ligase
VGGIGILFRCLAGGAAILAADKETTLEEAVRRLEPTHMSMVAAQLRRYLDWRAETGGNGMPRGVLVGGGPVPADLVEKAREQGLPVCLTYGLTEMASQVATTVPGATWESPHYAGRVLRYRQLRIGEDHEILVRGRTRFSGYVEGGEIERPFSPDGWFATGDLGRLTAEGDLEVLGRRDHRFVSGGENIQPEELEAALRAVEGIEEALVVPVPDEEFGQRPVAFVRGRNPVDTQALRSALADVVPGFMVPDRVHDWPESLPTAGVKPDRAYFRRLALRYGESR